MARKIHTRQKRRHKVRPHQGGHKVFKKLKLKRLKRAGLLQEKQKVVEVKE
ncbi:MAG TPA: hypothetical protein VJI32_00945 [Candidatus Nanoarchaeia archaeon]|nr:hypothetical protein [Candidatus Nanoarchaeia archaeon]